MKTIQFFSILFILPLWVAAQKNVNWKVYDKHPAIEITNAFNDAYVSGDVDKLKSLDTNPANNPPISDEQRDFGIGAQILRELGISKIKLITNHKKKRIGLIGYGLEIVENIHLDWPESVAFETGSIILSRIDQLFPSACLKFFI